MADASKPVQRPTWISLLIPSLRYLKPYNQRPGNPASSIHGTFAVPSRFRVLPREAEERPRRGGTGGQDNGGERWLPATVRAGGSHGGSPERGAEKVTAINEQKQA